MIAIAKVLMTRLDVILSSRLSGVVRARTFLEAGIALTEFWGESSL
jgi:hypothetical protein